MTTVREKLAGITTGCPIYPKSTFTSTVICFWLLSSALFTFVHVNDPIICSQLLHLFAEVIHTHRFTALWDRKVRNDSAAKSK